MPNAKAYSAASATSSLAPITIARRDPTERDVQIDILFCGICHSDLPSGAERVDRRHAHDDINAYLNLLRRDGNITLVGAPEQPLGVAAFTLIMGRRSLSGSPIGGIHETQEMLDFCGVHNVTADVEVIPIQKVNEAYNRLLKSDVKYRFSIDMASLKAS
jgi:D-arabinose 1-dehydrogenase-like Zn-dependent alcohol dehydrogenase